MKQIISHIEYLLTENDCVIVPGFGGFVIQSVAAKFTEKEVLPPAREICFNAGLLHDDGLLLASIAQVAGISYGEARRIVQNDLELFATELSGQRQVEFGKVGTFSLDEAQNLVFESKSSSENDIHAFGLSPVKMALLSDLTKREEPVAAVAVNAGQDGDTIQIRFSKRKALRGVASVAAVWLLWVFSTPVSDRSHQTSCAGFIGRPDLMKTIIDTPAVAAKDTVAKPQVAITKSIAAMPEENITEETVVAKNDAATTSEERYFIVLGSFQSETSANRHLDQLTALGIRNVKVQKLGTLMRTTLRGFADKTEAEKYLSSIHYDRDEYHEAWLYCKK